VNLKYSTTKAIVDIYNCATSQAAIDCFRTYIAQFHIDTFTSGEVDLNNRKRNVFHAMEWPDRWRDYYFKSGMLEHDPVVDALGRFEGAFTWTELRSRRGLSSAGTDALTRVAAEGWTDGLIVPLHRGGTHYGLVSLVAQNHILEQQQKADLTAASLVFHDRMRHLVPSEGFRVPPAGLTPREIECLRLVAKGLSDLKAGEALGIGGATVHEHAERAKRKLGAGNRAELVALAKSFAIIPS
jgi:LuxR family quorum sensing-dependent transcriptional regulator